MAALDPNQSRGELRITQEHSSAFVRGMFSQLGIEIVDIAHKDRLWHIRLPDTVRADLGVSKARYEVTLDRVLPSPDPTPTCSISTPT